jgi:hypothetical protein
MTDLDPEFREIVDNNFWDIMEAPMNELDRQEITCPTCGGSGMVPCIMPIYRACCQVDYYEVGGTTICPTCKGNCMILEPLESQVSRLQEIARELAKYTVPMICACNKNRLVLCTECPHALGSEQCIQARIEAAAKQGKGGER